MESASPMKIHWVWHVLGPTIAGAILGITLAGPIGALFAAFVGSIVGVGIALSQDG